jgi:O-acetyl-ADP-ribose deacetylase (regulator of RNase III)
MKPEVVTRRIEAFHQRFGEAHLDFAYHAAFPLALTPDLLYRLWANFQRDRNGEALKIPWLAVADLLLSSLCDEVGYELYEMETEVRNALLRELKVNPCFGEKRIHELSDFLLVYVKQQLESHDPDIRDFAQVQTWTALAYTKPSEAAREIASTLAGLKLEEKAEWIRMASIVETFAEPLAGFQPLLIYSRGMASFVRNDIKRAASEFNKVYEQQGKQINVAGINLKIPLNIDFLYSVKSRITVVEGDITQQRVDAIVNSTDLGFSGGGDVDRAIHRAAGSELRKACSELNQGWATGEAQITKGYNLSARWVIHTVGPVWKGGNYQEAQKLSQCYSNCLALAEQYSITTIAFPAISTGGLGFPIEQASKIAVNEVKFFLKRNTSVKKVVFVCRGKIAYDCYLKSVNEIIES